MKNIYKKLINNIGAVILITILGLVLLGATYVNLGPTSLIDGDIGVTAGHGYYIDDVLLTYSDVDAQQADAALTNISGLTYVEDSLIKLTANDTYAVRTLAEVKTDLSLNYVENLKVKLDGTTAPTAATDDITLGYAVGSRWFDITNDKEYVCLDNTDGAAVWTETTGAGGGAGTFLELTDTPAAYDNGKYAKSTAAGVIWDTPAGGGTVTTSGSPTANDISRFTDATTIEGLSYAEFKTALDLEVGTDILAEQTIGIANDNLVEIDDADAADNDYAKLTVNGLEGRSYTEVKTDLSLNNVTNDAQIAKSIGTAQGDLIYFTASATPTVLAKGTATQVLAMNAGATAPEWVAAGAGGYTNLTSFVDQTAFRVFYSNTAGDVTELALGTDGQVLTSNGAAVAPTFEDAGGSGETNTASNIGTGAKIFKQKTGVDLEFRRIDAGSNQIDISWYIEENNILKESYTDQAYKGIIYGSTKHIGQSFTTTSAHNIGKVSLYLDKEGSPPNDLIIEIKASSDDLPTGNVLASGKISASDISAAGWYDILLSPYYDLDNATKYVILASTIGGDDSNKYKWGYKYEGTYADGTKILSSNGGNSWTVDTGSDCNFKVYSIELTYKDQIEIDVNEENIRLDDLKATEDNTDLNASTSAHGLLKKLDDNDTHYLDGKGAWTVPTGSYTNLTSFVDQTAWRVFYSNTAGDIVELALGADGTYLKSNGAAAAPTFNVPGGAGDVVKVGTPVNDQVGVWTGDGTIEGHASFTYASGTGTVTATAFVGTLTGNVTGDCSGSSGTCSGLAATATALATGRTIGGVSFDGTANIVPNIVTDTTPELGGEMDCGAHTIGFTLQTDTGTGAKTIDWKLGNKMKFTFGAGNVAFTFTAPTNPCTLMLTLIQDGTGSRTITWPATVKWPGGTEGTLTTTANARDKVALDWDGSQYDAVISKDFK